ncbi:hypothetical protein [Streptomyces sp. NPDC001530]|uniref:hypothetical protein n=1 Tax=Streptomyces sp. NPDC001530 TaxID=3364582 RepID=UPI00369D8D3C
MKRLSPEREAGIRELIVRATPVGAAVASPGALADLLAELDAVRKERDEAVGRVAELEAELADYTEPDVDGVGRTYESYHPPQPADDPARCLENHRFSPRDGWRMICGSCDHGSKAECHRIEGVTR